MSADDGLDGGGGIEPSDGGARMALLQAAGASAPPPASAITRLGATLTDKALGAYTYMLPQAQPLMMAIQHPPRDTRPHRDDAGAGEHMPRREDAQRALVRSSHLTGYTVTGVQYVIMGLAAYIAAQQSDNSRTAMLVALACGGLYVLAMWFKAFLKGFVQWIVYYLLFTMLVEPGWTILSEAVAGAPPAETAVPPYPVVSPEHLAHAPVEAPQPTHQVPMQPVYGYPQHVPPGGQVYATAPPQYPNGMYAAAPRHDVQRPDLDFMGRVRAGWSNKVAANLPWYLGGRAEAAPAPQPMHVVQTPAPDKTQTRP